MPKLSKKTEEDLPTTARATSTEIQKDARKAVKPKKTEPPAKKPVKKQEDRVDLMTRFRNYLQGVSFELRKVVWPTRKETIGSTAVVLIIVLISGIFLGIVDSILSYVIQKVVG